MSRMFKYKGNVSGFGHNEVVLYVPGNDDVPPIRLSVPKALFLYIDDTSGADSEEKYYDKIYKYDNILNLLEIVIPSKKEGCPSKIITQEKISSEEFIVFGEAEQMEIPENELEPMSREEYSRYLQFRDEHGYDEFYNM